LHFEVEDTGFGIAIEEMDCLFEAFVQTEAGRQSNQGTGLGLMISRRFVELMGGKIQARSLLGVGSVFEFDIPIHSVGCTPILPLLTSGEQTKTGLPLCRVLVVTVPQESEVLTRLLSTTDMVVDCATSSDELLAYWQKHQPHLIVVDPDLPDISQTLKTIQTDSLRPAIFALTDSPLEHTGKISELPYHDVLYRPLQAEELFAKLAEHLGVHCIYGALEPFPLAPSLVRKVVSADLTVMSVEWIAKLHHAARGCSDRQVLQLIEQIPLIHLQLAKGLEELVYNFRFEEIVKLTQSQMQ
jgi:CheY-like chemotaxis protein